MNTNRRQFLSLLTASAALPLGAPRVGATAIETSANIVIIGAGAAGTALANRLVRRLNGARITLVDPRKEHLYQPGLTLVAAGLKPADYVVSETTDWLPDGVDLIREAASGIDPETKTVTTSGGQTLLRLSRGRAGPGARL